MEKIKKYYELHITVEPDKGATAEKTPYDIFTDYARLIGWKTSKFDHDDVDGIAGKWFATRHAVSKRGAKTQMRLAIAALQEAGYAVTRWKIEKIILDSKYGSTTDDLA